MARRTGPPPEATQTTPSGGVRLRALAAHPLSDQKPGALPTEPVTRGQRVVLVESMLVTWKTLEHLEYKGFLKPDAKGRINLRRNDGLL